MIHHSNTICDDCGERHTPGNSAECIEELQKQISKTKEEIIALKAEWKVLEKDRNMPHEEIRVELDLSDAIAVIERQQQQIAALKAEVKRLWDNYNDLTMEVSKKYPDETRHQTAKRYIKLAERGTIGGMGSGGSLKQEAKNESK